MKAFSEEPSGLKKFRLVLIAALSVTVVVSAALSIFMIVTGAQDETLWKVTGTFGLVSAFSLIMLLQTSSLYRLGIIDKVGSIVGTLASTTLVFYALDSIWEWEVVNNLFNFDYELMSKTFSTIGIAAGLTVALGLLRSSLNINGKIKVATLLIASGYAVLLSLRIWFEQWFTEEITESYADEFGNNTQSYTYTQELEFWSDTILIIGILLGMMLIISLVSHILGGRKAQTLGHSSDMESLVQIKLSAKVGEKLRAVALSEGVSPSDMVEKLLQPYSRDKK